MDRQDCRARIGESRDIFVRIRNHQVNIEGKSRDLSDRLDHRRTDRDVGHKVAVHDIHVQQVRAGFLNFADVLT